MRLGLIVVGVLLVLAGLGIGTDGESFVLRGTDSSVLLVIVGALIAAYGVVDTLVRSENRRRLREGRPLLGDAKSPPDDVATAHRLEEAERREGLKRDWKAADGRGSDAADE
jgi:hypothetical protein